MVLAMMRQQPGAFVYRACYRLGAASNGVGVMAEAMASKAPHSRGHAPVPRQSADELRWHAAEEAHRNPPADRLRWLESYLADPAGHQAVCVCCGRASDEGVVFRADVDADDLLMPNQRRAWLAAVTLDPAGLVVPVCPAHRRKSAWPVRVTIALYDHLLAVRVSGALRPRQLAPGPSEARTDVLTASVSVVARDVTPTPLHECPSCRCGRS